MTRWSRGLNPFAGWAALYRASEGESRESITRSEQRVAYGNTCVSPVGVRMRLSYVGYDTRFVLLTKKGAAVRGPR